MTNIIFKNVKNWSSYINAKSKVNSIFNNVLSQSFDDKNKILVNLTLLKLFNSKSFETLCKSKGINEILAKRLNLSYLKNIKPTDKIDENFFYKLFENIEKSTNERLAKSGIDVTAANKYIKLADDEICKDPKVLEEFITKLENAKNSELVNKVLNQFELSEENFKYSKDSLLKILENCEKSPEIVKKTLRVQNKSLYCTNNNINILTKKNNKISDELFEYYLDLEKTHPEYCNPFTLMDINSFLLTKGCDEKLLKEIFEKSIKTGNPEAFSKIALTTNENNLEFLKKCLQNGTLDPESLFKLKMIGINPACKNQLDKICEETYRPLLNVFKKNPKYSRECDFFAGNIAQIRIENPELYKKLEDSKILDLVKDEKINPRILTSLNKNSELTPEILSDAKKLFNGESIVKRFETTKDILKNTTAGDVVLVNGKMYINNNGKLEPWNMTEEKFNELFPLVDRFSTLQGMKGCYFISVLNSLYKNPRTRGNYYKMFEQKGNDIFVTIPAYKDYGGAIKFPNGEIKLHYGSADAAKNVQMLERAYSKTALRKSHGSDIIPNSEDPLISNNLDYLSQRIIGGHPIEVLRDFNINGQNLIQELSNKTSIKTFLDNYGQNQRYIINECHLTGKNTGHAISIKEYDPKTETVTIIDPHSSGSQQKMSLNEMLKDIYSLIITHVKG